MLTPEAPTEPAKKPRRRTPVQVQAQRMSKLLSIEFGLALREARLRAGLTQTEVAKRARVTQTYVSQVELGEQNVTLASMARLARAVGLDVSLFPAISSIRTLVRPPTRKVGWWHVDG
jgi:DNA-binding XRE family transcriptional regulator